MSRICREIFCSHFPWKLKDENLRKISPKFRRSLRNISQELRSGGLRAQTYGLHAARLSRKQRKSRQQRGNSNSYKRGVECWICGNHRNHGNWRTKEISPKFSCISFSDACSGHGRPRLWIKDGRAKELYFPALRAVKAFGPGRPPGYPPRRPRDIPSKNFYV